MTIKVIGAGFGRTGTATLKVALETLGFTKCYHSTSLGEHPTHGPQWIGLLEGKPVDWDRLFAGYQGTMGLPTVFFYKEIMAHYPEARVILTCATRNGGMKALRKRFSGCRHADRWR